MPFASFQSQQMTVATDHPGFVICGARGIRRGHSPRAPSFNLVWMSPCRGTSTHATPSASLNAILFLQVLPPPIHVIPPSSVFLLFLAIF
ncbi:MAG: hypothetical protein NTU41_07315, partial [Chloroflexi bacterium]|nr:hypothetical protein [Chloroflexota bacterium]